MSANVISAAGCGGMVAFTLAEAVHAQTNATALEPGGRPEKFAVSASLRQPAVSGVNGKMDYSGGEMNSSAGHNISGSISLPVSHQFGFQADALYSRISEVNFYGGAGHLFWRDPDYGLLGLTGGYLYRDSMDSVATFQSGVEGELYWHRFTLGFFGGVGNINYQYSTPFIETRLNRFVGRVSADYYPLDNLRVGAAFSTAFREELGKVDIEYQTPINGIALTGEAASGNYGYHHWLLGVRYYFGSKKSLRARQRQDDPPGLMPQILQSLGVYGAEFNSKGKAYIAANPGTGTYHEQYGTSIQTIIVSLPSRQTVPVTSTP